MRLNKPRLLAGLFFCLVFILFWFQISGYFLALGQETCTGQMSGKVFEPVLFKKPDLPALAISRFLTSGFVLLEVR